MNNLRTVQLAILSTCVAALLSGCATQRFASAVRTGNINDVRRYLREGVDIDSNCDGGTPLIIAIRYGKPKIAKQLIDSGADVDAESSWSHDRGRTPLMMAAMAGQLATVRQLLDRGAQVNVADRKGLTALMFAVASPPDSETRFEEEWGVRPQRDEVIKLLLGKRANIEAVDDHDRTPLICAGNPSAARILLDHGANIMARAKNGHMSLERRLVLGGISDINTAKVLISRGSRLPRPPDGHALITVPSYLRFSDRHAKERQLPRSEGGQWPALRERSLALLPGRYEFSVQYLWQSRIVTSTGSPITLFLQAKAGHVYAIGYRMPSDTKWQASITDLGQRNHPRKKRRH